MLLSPRYHCIYYSSVEWENCLFFLYVQVLVVEFWKDRICNTMDGNA